MLTEALSGLLASLWQFPQAPLSRTSSLSATERKAEAKKFVSIQNLGTTDTSKAKYLGEVDSLLHVFSHLRLTMHVHRFQIDEDTKTAGLELPLPGPRKWICTGDMGNQTLSTGMRRCWELVHAQDKALS
jgi:A/G-specific adenine glycosylase